MQTEVIVIGGGHAGIEAALASARIGAETLLLTQDPDKIGHISCNPAIGGIAKGQLVREIDALGGMMGLAADANALQYRLLNSSKGPAVQSPRAQIDRWSYSRFARAYLERQPRLAIQLDEAVGLEVLDGKVTGVRTFLGGVIHCKAVVICSGTFARGRLHLGQTAWPGGRIGESGAGRLSEALEELGLPLFRLRTGTCPRLDARTIDFSAMRPEPGDSEPVPFSYLTEKPASPNLLCHSVWTTEETHRLVEKNLHLAPITNGTLAGSGPRYCPNFETKVAYFPDKRSHHLFIEPEGRDSVEVYVNGLYLSLPMEVQEAVVRTIPGLEKARIIRYGYSVEYDAVKATELRETLEAKQISGLFTAGQSNGTSGYEEAAAQGLLAGANAALKVLGRPAFRLGRDQAYIGVLADDLTLRGTEEPYRLFTSRSEYRLLLRQDNADLRLTELGAAAGLTGEDRLARVRELKREIALGTEELNRHFRRNDTGASEKLAEYLRHPDSAWEEAAELSEVLRGLSPRAAEQLLIAAKYDGYIARHLRKIEQLDKNRRVRLPEGMNYRAVSGLSHEALEKLERIRPENLDQALRISGVSPADAAILLVWLDKRSVKKPPIPPAV